MADGTGLIYFRCAALDHQKGVDGRTADTLTVHEGKWSYCPHDVRAKDHEWIATGGMQIEMLRRGSPTINLDLDVRPHLSKTAAPPAPPVGGEGNGGSVKKAPAQTDPKRRRTAR